MGKKEEVMLFNKRREALVWAHWLATSIPSGPAGGGNSATTAEAEAGVFSNPADSLNEQLAFRMGQVFLVLKVLNISLRFKLTGMRL